MLLLAKDLVETCLAEWKLSGQIVATAKGEALAGLEFKHPLYDAHEGYQRLSPIYLGDYVTLDSGTGVVHSAPAYGIEDFVSCKAHGLAADQIISPGMVDGHYAARLPR